VTSKDLKDYTTTEKDMKKGSSRHPPPNLRNPDEDLFDQEPSSATGSRTGSDPDAFESERSLADQ